MTKKVYALRYNDYDCETFYGIFSSEKLAKIASEWLAETGNYLEISRFYIEEVKLDVLQGKDE